MSHTYIYFPDLGNDVTLELYFYKVKLSGGKKDKYKIYNNILKLKLCDWTPIHLFRSGA